MITINDILYSITSKVGAEFNEDVFVDETVQGFEKSCFFVQILPSLSTAATRITNKKVVLISIKYLLTSSDSKMKFNEVVDRLEQLFTRSIKVGKSYLHIASIEPNIYKDEVGDVLDFLMTINYYDEIKQDLDDFDIMQYLEITKKIEN